MLCYQNGPMNEKYTDMKHVFSLSLEQLHDFDVLLVPLVVEYTWSYLVALSQFLKGQLYVVFQQITTNYNSSCFFSIQFIPFVSLPWVKKVKDIWKNIEKL